MKIGQLGLFRLSSLGPEPVRLGRYGSRYQGQRGPTASRGAPEFPPRRRLRALVGATSPNIPRRRQSGAPERTELPDYRE